MSTKSKKKSIDELLGIDYESPEWKAGVRSYNNRILLKHDIQSRQFLRVRRLLREGDIGVLDKENQNLLADFLDSAIEAFSSPIRRRGRPQNDEINDIELMRELSREYNRLHFEEGLTIESTLQAVSELSGRLGRRLGVKRVEQLCIEFNTYRPHYEGRLYELYSAESSKLTHEYRILVGDKAYIDRISSMDDCRPIELHYSDLADLTDQPLPPLHQQAVRALAAKYALKECDVERRLAWEE